MEARLCRDTFCLLKHPKGGAHSAGDTPVTIPNTEVKPSSGDNTVMWEDSTVPHYKEAIRKDGFFIMWGQVIYLQAGYPFSRKAA